MIKIQFESHAEPIEAYTKSPHMVLLILERYWLAVLGSNTFWSN